MKKKLSAILAAAALCVAALALAACGSASPSKVVEDALDAYKAGDDQALAGLCSGTDLLSSGEESLTYLFADTFEDPEGVSEETAAKAQAVSDLLISKLRDFDYTIGQETVDGGTATVEVALTTYDIGRPFGTALDAFIDDAFYLAFTEAFGGAEADVNKVLGTFFDDLSAGLNKQTEKTVESTAILTLSREGGEWVIDELSDEAGDALSGGMLSAYKKWEELGE